LGGSLQLSIGDLNESKKEISIYGEGKVSSKILANCFGDLKKAFPKLPDGWYDILEKLLDVEKFTDQRFIDATLNLIKTCVYPEPTIANILNYNKYLKLWTYDEILKYTKDFSPESSKKFWANMKMIDKEKKLWRMISI
jgi:hypothetical protein